MTTGDFRNNKVGSYNILLSVDPIFVNTLKDKTNTSKAISEEVKSSRFSTMFQSTDGNFLELRHDLQPKKGKGFGSKMTLKTYDPGLGFLNDLFFEFTQKSLKKLVNSKRLEAQKISDLFTRMKETGAQVDALIAGISTAADTIKNWDTSWDTTEDKENITGFNSIAGFEYTDTDAWAAHKNIRGQLEGNMERLETQLDPLAEEHAELVKEIQSHVSSKSLPKVYIMYGIGNDLRDWAGPFETYLSDVKHENNGKQETVTYEMVVDLITEKMRERVEETFDKSNLFERSSVVIRNYGRATGTSNPLGGLVFSTGSHSFHDVIVKLISNYLYSLGIKNHIIMLPFLDNVLRGVIEKSIINNIDWRTGGDMESIFTDKDGVYSSTTISNISEDLFTYDQAGYHRARPPSIDRAWGTPLLKNKFYDTVLKEVFESISIQETAADSPSDTGAPLLVSTNEGPGIIVNDPFKVDVDPGTGLAGAPGVVEGNRIVSINFGPKYSETQDMDDFSWDDPLREVIRSLNAVSVDNAIEYHGEFVSDINIKNTLLKKFGGGTFMGYAALYGRARQLSGDLPPPIDDEPLFLFGDRNLIKLLIYGDIDRLAQSDKESYTNENYLVETGGLPSFSVLGTWNLQDPIWNILKNDIEGMIRGDSNYFRETYRKFHLPGGYNLGYFLDMINSNEDLGLQIPDEFALTSSDPDSEKLLEYVYNTAFPMFLANVDNANVLSYNFDVGKFLYSQLFGTVREIFSTVATRYYSQGNPIVDEDTTKEEVAEKMVEVLDNIRSRTLGLGGRLTPTFSVGSRIDIDDMADDLADLLLIETVGLSRTTRRGKGSSVVGFMNLFLDLFSQAYEGTIRTLPMYHLSNQVQLLQQCLVLLKPIKGVHTNLSELEGSKSVTDFLSGIYRLLGFTHVIGQKQAYSEFRLQKDIRAELSNAEG